MTGSDKRRLSASIFRSLRGVNGIYQTSDGRRAARYSRFSQRGAGTITDIGICFWIPYVLLGTLTSYLSNSSGQSIPQTVNLAGVSWLGAVTLCVLGYFTISVAHGRTVGMRIFGMRVIEPVTARPPGYRRALVRSLVLFIFGVAAFILFNYVLSEPSASTRSPIGQAILIGGFVVFIAGMWSHLWIIFDARGQAFHDHLAGVVVIDKLIDIPKDIEIFATPVARPVVASPRPARPAEPQIDSASGVRYVNPRAPGGSRIRRHGRNRSRGN